MLYSPQSPASPENCLKSLELGEPIPYVMLKNTESSRAHYQHDPYKDLARSPTCPR